MLKILDEKEQKTVGKIMNEHPNCTFIFKASDLTNMVGTLYAVSDMKDEFYDLCRISQELNEKKDGYCYVTGGEYNMINGAANVQYKIRK
ncbi:MAG: hypothetical protein NC180_03330 [Muribaculaceae bacterium]|nr:hypothetical protein [Roseburia sp.]MCM1431275.1 hypothetical protein [Muribaculaceae bacterium]MCM1492239.1 hypothetical protein [Muribaculaceae bacterium]